ncbi:MAG: saccharopine dehydrogenase NADP-binding domain-containing protein [Candidatus Delongbacteria bacterium]|jgi:lysine 6-dehydrogenase|nr:saccharopine dehydrogenase NADP-binding domain-containing protein [Candidatus Delongbacteria bacterium]
MKVVVLGAGMVGSAMAIDIKDQYDVVVADINEEALNILKNEYGMNTIKADLKDKQTVKDIIADADLVVDAVPGFMGYETVKTIIECGKNVVDIAFFPEDSEPLDKLAKEKGVICITDIGVAPGMCNVILGYHAERMKVDSYLCLVGGLPKKRTWPWEYKAPFSPCDVIEEYIRPARYKESGVEVTKTALSDPELIEFEQCGTLEAWNSDGLRSLIRTIPDVPNMKEKTMRYPGHIEKARILRESGFFSQEPIDFNGTKITPLQMTERLLFSDKNWKLGRFEEEFTVMRVIVTGEENGVKKEYIYDLYDEYCTDTRTSSMARTTGYSCTAAVNLVAKGIYKEVGLSPAEYLGKDEASFRGLLEYLKERNVNYDLTVK